MFIDSFYCLILKLVSYHNEHFTRHKLACLGLYMLILIHKFYAFRKGPGVGGLGL
jgi:hypothetical protein